MPPPTGGPGPRWETLSFSNSSAVAMELLWWVDVVSPHAAAVTFRQHQQRWRHQLDISDTRTSQVARVQLIAPVMGLAQTVTHVLYVSLSFTSPRFIETQIHIWWLQQKQQRVAVGPGNGETRTSCLLTRCCCDAARKARRYFARSNSTAAAAADGAAISVRSARRPVSGSKNPNSN